MLSVVSKAVYRYYCRKLGICSVKGCFFLYFSFLSGCSLLGRPPRLVLAICFSYWSRVVRSAVVAVALVAAFLDILLENSGPSGQEGRRMAGMSDEESPAQLTRTRGTFIYVLIFVAANERMFLVLGT